ncbi:YncE family protein [Accumulibacter sp.]|uniref:YncE family protein n=1 Tax=Accumulibacter sp. TaxID=2053492 RepID=UPI0025EFE642|nr:YncE family protein [Accumulibacter sp.]MCM8595792.1 YncE family protein [Accumulibacter sp.]MCM8626513.1 YncE family protein [Accumulibacter sp.]MDS4049940.1 YncE family protein [Accumulibacter sp.]
MTLRRFVSPFRRLASAVSVGLLCAAGVTAAAAGDLAIALNSADGTLSLIDTETYSVTGKVSVCKEPHHLMPTPDDKSLIVACAASNQLVFFDPRTGKEQKRVRNISDPYQLGYSPDLKWFVATSLRLDRVDLYDPNDFRLVARLPAPKTPSHLAFDDNSQFVFVTLQDSNQIMAIDLATQKVAWVMPVAATPAGIVMSPDNRYLLVACMGEGVVEVIDWRARQSVRKIATGTAAHNLQPKGDKRHFYVSNRTVDGSISLLDTRTLSVVEKYEVPGGPDDMIVRADGKELWATARFARNVQVVDLVGKKLKLSIPVGSSPHGVFFLNHAGLR